MSKSEQNEIKKSLQKLSSALGKEGLKEIISVQDNESASRQR
jgi:hypothetical protein